MKNIKNFISNNKKSTAIIFALIGVLLICISYFPNRVSEHTYDSDYNYAQMLEKRTKEIIEAITGDNTTEVMVTLKNVYTSQDSYKTTFTANNKDTQKVYNTIPSPDIAGVMIVCTTLRNSNDFLTIKKAVATCLDIPQSKIYIIGGKTEYEKADN